MKGAHESSALPESERHGDWGHHRGSHSWFERGQLPLSFSVKEFKFLYYSASNMMAVKQDRKMR